MNPLDLFTMANVFFCFGMYLLGHMTIFRFISVVHVIEGLINFFLGAAVLNCVVSGIFFRSFLSSPSLYSAGDVVLACIVSLISLGMMCFLYVIGIFGPYETSVRIRLIRELQKRGSKGVTLEEILKDYSDSLMVKERLKRLTGSGELIYQDDYYRIGTTLNIFSVIDLVIGLLRKAYGRAEVKR